MTDQTERRFPILDSEERRRKAGVLAAQTLKVSQLTDDFAKVDRIPRYADGHRENDVEHSYMLAVGAREIGLYLNETLGLSLDTNKMSRFGLAHDLLEVKVGDVATFDLNAAQLAEKERREQAAKAELMVELPAGIAADLEEYEHQDTPEAILTRLIDKLLPIAVDTTGDGVRVLREDYRVESFDELLQSHDALHARINEKFGQDFPDVVATHAVLLGIFEGKYQAAIGNRKPEVRLREPTEVERKYLIDLTSLPARIDLKEVPHSRLRQGYIAVGGDGSETRVRSFDDDRFTLTVKSNGDIAREEQESKITKELFDALWDQTKEGRVEKTRYYIPHEDMTIELDIYAGHLEGLVTAEVEFSGRATEAMVKAATFEKPEWFGEDVSTDLRYKNHSLAKGLPHHPVPLGAKSF